MRLETYRRAIIRPLTESAAELMRAGELPPESDFEGYRIPPETYEQYFQLFNDLERVCGVAGDDFEVEELEADRLPGVIQLLKTTPRRDTTGKLDTALDDLLDRVWGICHRAQRDQIGGRGGLVFLVL